MLSCTPSIFGHTSTGSVPAPSAIGSAGVQASFSHVPPDVAHSSAGVGGISQRLVSIFQVPPSTAHCTSGVGGISHDSVSVFHVPPSSVHCSSGVGSGSSVETSIQSPLPATKYPAGTFSCVPSMFGQASAAGAGMSHELVSVFHVPPSKTHCSSGVGGGSAGGVS